MAARKRSNDVTPLIPGFKKVETHLIGFWKPEISGQQVRGIVGQAVEVKGREDKLNTFYTLTLTTDDGGPIVSSEDKKIPAQVGMIIGVGGKMLLTFLNGHAGQEVVLVYRGKGKAKAGQSAPKLFDTYAREDTE